MFSSAKKYHEESEKAHQRKIVANHIFNKSVVSRIQKELLQLNNKNTNNPTENQVKDLNRHHVNDDIQIANKHMKICSIPLVVREMKTKTTMRYHFTPTRKAITFLKRK